VDTILFILGLESDVPILKVFHWTMEDLRNYREDLIKKSLRSALLSDCEDLVAILLEHKDLDKEFEIDDLSPLAWACGNDRLALAKLLATKYGEHLNRRDNMGLAPLLRAAENGHEAVVKWLN
jgi:ankyrin repeat protein